MNMIYSIRMRSAENGPHETGGTHISGAERLVKKDSITSVATTLIERALTHPKGNPDFINLTIDAIPSHQVHGIPALSITTSMPTTLSESHRIATNLLSNIGIHPSAITAAFHQLSHNSPSCSGAWLIHKDTGEIYESPVRVTRMDVEDEESFLTYLEQHHVNSPHTREALVLASKVLACNDIIAELCWSDDPDYTTGYISYDTNYHRLTHMKHQGSSIGGRAFFVTSFQHIESIITFLSSSPVLVYIEENQYVP